MKLWPFRKTKEPARVVVPYPDDIEDVPVYKHHALRALCGAFMDRHAACQSPHPFCGSKGEFAVQMIVHAIIQRTPDGIPVLALYFSRAEAPQQLSSGDEPIDPIEYATALKYYELTPTRKAVVWLMSDGTYVARYGPILNPVEMDFSTGSIDDDAARTLYCNPEPAHVGWQYWESGLSAKQTVIPEFHFLWAGQVWIVDVDRLQQVSQHVATLKIADNPGHNWGIHDPRNRGSRWEYSRDGSDRSKVLEENSPGGGLPLGFVPWV